MRLSGIGNNRIGHAATLQQGTCISSEVRASLAISHVIKGHDAYFGAQLLSSDSLLEELGVSRLSAVERLQSPPPCSLGADTEEHQIIFHENEFVANAQENWSGSLKVILEGPSCSEDLRRPLIDTSNVPTNSKTMERPENAHLLGIDSQLEMEIDSVLKECCQNSSKPKLQRAPLIKTSERRPKSESVPTSSPFDGTSPAVEVEIRKRRFEGDMYTPRWVRGTGLSREGFCELCIPGVWLKIKQSAYWYHMNFYHGISAATGRPYSPPQAIRERKLPSSDGTEDLVQIEGLCASCQRWIILATRLCDAKRPNHQQDLGKTAWWRHAQKCAKKDRPSPRRTNDGA